MKLLNIGCGSVRPGPPWINLDNLHDQLKPGTPERINLDKELNYVNYDISKKFIPYAENVFDGILCSHVVEHFTCLEAVDLLEDCRRILKPGGILVVSVPDAEYFLSVHDEDKPENAVELFGEPICPDEPWHKSFFDYALFYNQHKQVLTFSSLRCILIKAGFPKETIARFGFRIEPDPVTNITNEIEKIVNRRKFSVELCAVK